MIIHWGVIIVWFLLALTSAVGTFRIIEDLFEESHPVISIILWWILYFFAINILNIRFVTVS